MNFVKTILLCLAFVVSSPLQAKTIKMATSDGLIIHAELSTPKEMKGQLPAVILIHQGGSDHSEWHFLVPALIKMNYVVMAYDVRGHGKSDKVDNIYALFNDPAQAPNDLTAVLKYLKKKKYVDHERIAVIGASVGANLANVAISNMGVKTAVAMSGKTSAVYNLANSKKLKMKSVFYISSNERDGTRAKWAQELFDLTKEPRKITIVSESEEHGVGIFDDRPKLKGEVLAWLKETL
jgi:dienelactone hydrolase